MKRHEIELMLVMHGVQPTKVMVENLTGKDKDYVRGWIRGFKDAYNVGYEEGRKKRQEGS